MPTCSPPLSRRSSESVEYHFADKSSDRPPLPETLCQNLRLHALNPGMPSYERKVGVFCSVQGRAMSELDELKQRLA
ncbi:MAG: hypothetical protein AAF327_21915, partial [Cyanobacteria bacterium P01_A01_bin.37]